MECKLEAWDILVMQQEQSLLCHLAVSTTQYSAQKNPTPLSAVLTSVRPHLQPNRYVSCEILIFSYWWSQQIWRN